LNPELGISAKAFHHKRKGAIFGTNACTKMLHLFMACKENALLAGLHSVLEILAKASLYERKHGFSGQRALSSLTYKTP